MAALLGVVVVLTFGCEAPRTERIRQLRIQLDSARYELQLRQDEITDMEERITRPRKLRPGEISLGVSREWPQRHTALKEAETRLLVRIRELEQQIKAVEDSWW